MTAAWRAVGLFLLLTICLSGIFWVLIGYLIPIAYCLVASLGICSSVSADFRTPSSSGRPQTLSGWAKHPTGW